MDDFPSPTDEGISSPESEEYPHKPTDQEYLYNDSGILLDESSMNNVTQGDEHANGHLDDDDLSDTSSTDPSDYHITRPELQEQPMYEDNYSPCNNTSVTQEVDQDDSAIHENGEETEVMEDTIVSTEAVKPVNEAFEKLSPRPPSPPQITIEESEDTPFPVVSVVVNPPAEDLEEVTEEPIEKSVVKKDEDQQSEEDESSEESEEEEELVDFVPGVVCNDVETALLILKTHYRLSSSTLKKCIITSPDNKTKRYSAPIFSYDRSRWNLHDLIRGPNETMPWWSKTREPEDMIKEKENYRRSMNDTIDRKDEEIAKLLQQVLDDENRQKKPAVQEPEIIQSQQEPGLEAVPDKGEPEEPEDDNKDTEKKKKRNVFQRMMRAVRKRLSRNRHRA